MAGSSQPQHFFVAGCVFADFAITVIFIKKGVTKEENFKCFSKTIRRENNKASDI